SAAELYHNGKINRILVSGDNHIKNYDEATAMLNALVALGVPDTAIKCDYAGFSTYDSMIRAKKVWGLDKMTIISQHWHNQRALYIARSAGIDAVAFDANDLKSRKLKLKYTIREWFSRTKALWNIIFNKQPHFLGQQEEI
ncbi:MAG: YdcF family protein, partial [Bacteroidales bacterium]|nr:YdcF family protein [Bacteroidales bacterium]